MKSLLIKSGRIVDPSQELDFVGDLLIEDGCIKAAIPSGEVTLSEFKCEESNVIVIDASEKIVCPGFIDIHMHEDGLDEDGKPVLNIAQRMLRMGVTTAIGGNCGVLAEEPDVYLDAVDQFSLPINIGLLVGHGFVRSKVDPEVDRYTNLDESLFEAMTKLTQKYLKAGCFGISFGVKYIPGTTMDEMMSMAKLCSENGLIISSHVRGDVDKVFDGARELAEIGRLSGARMQFSHIGSMGGYGQMKELLEDIRGFREEGIDMMCDCYPYEAFSTEIGNTTYDDGFLESYNANYDAIQLCSGKYAGQRCTKEIFDEVRRDAPETGTVGFFMKKEDVEMALASDFVMLGSDGMDSGEMSHPRGAGAFPRFLRNYVDLSKAATDHKAKDCDSVKLPLVEGLAKVTSMPAKRLGLASKGNLRPGSDGDIVIFDPREIADGASFRNPLAGARGIDYVLIAGEVALDHGNIINENLGKSVRKGKA